MARLFTTGFELGTPSRIAEGFTTESGTATITSDASVVRSGARSLKMVMSTQFGGATYSFTGVLSRTYWGRLAVRYTGGVSGVANLMSLFDGNNLGWLIRNTSDTLQINVQKWSDGTVNIVGPTLTAGQWYVLEVGYTPNTGAVELRVDGVSYGTATTDVMTSTAFGLLLGGTGGTVAQTVNFDDMALNDDQGSAQNSWCGLGQVVCLKPTADSANTGYAVSHTGDTLWGSVDNTPPLGTALSDTTTVSSKIKDATSNTTDNYQPTLQTYTAAGVPAGGTIVLVQGLCNFGTSGTGNPNDSAGIQVVSNPVVGEVTGNATVSTAAGTFPTGWTTLKTAVAYAPTVTLGTAPVMEFRKATANADASMADFIGLLVEYIPATSPAPAGSPIGPRNTLSRGVRNRGQMAAFLARLPKVAAATSVAVDLGAPTAQAVAAATALVTAATYPTPPDPTATVTTSASALLTAPTFLTPTAAAVTAATATATAASLLTPTAQATTAATAPLTAVSLLTPAAQAATAATAAVTAASLLAPEAQAATSATCSVTAPGAQDLGSPAAAAATAATTNLTAASLLTPSAQAATAAICDVTVPGTGGLPPQRPLTGVGL